MLLIAISVLIIVLAFPRAAAAKPFTLNADGQLPHIAVDDSGTGHIVWNQQVIGGDDVLHYCRLPRGTRSCSPEKTFNIPMDDFVGPRVLIGGGVVTLLTSRCCFPGDRLLILQSTDGGQSFGAPTFIARTAALPEFSPMGQDGGAALGPGAFQISTASSSTEGSFIQAAPVNPGVPVSTSARIDSDLVGQTGDTTSASVAFADPLSPVAAYGQITSGRTFLRFWDGSGDYNSIANWLPTKLVGAGDNPRLVGGLRGLYLLYRIGQPAKKRYVARRVTSAGPGPKIPVSDKGTPQDRDFIEDAGGNLHALWYESGNPTTLRYSRSKNGQKFSDPKRLAKGQANIFNPAVGAADDGGGWGLWTTESGHSVIKAAPFDPVSGGGGPQPCVPKVTYGKAVILAREGCLQKAGSSYSTSGAVRVNGLDLDPSPNGRALASASSKLVFDTGKGTLKSTGKVVAKAGNVQLDDGKLAWELPKNGGAIKDLAGNPAVFDTGKLKPPVEVLGLTVLGKTTPQIGGAQGMTVPVHLKLPQPFDRLLGGGVTGDATLRLDNPSGLMLAGTTLSAGSVFLGIAEVQDLKVVYAAKDPFILDGSARIILPVIKSSLDTDFGLRAGAFDHANATLNFDAPGRPVSQFTYLKSIGFQILTDPLKLSGLASVTAGPTVPGLNVAAAKIDGTVSYTFPKAPSPGIFRADGTGAIAGIPTADVFAQYETSGKLSLGGSFDLDSGFGPSLAGTVDGAVEIPSGNFDLFGSGDACGVPAIGCVGVKVLLSKKAAAGCGTAEVGPPGAKVSVSAGVAYLWTNGWDAFFGCDLKPYKSINSAQASATSATFKIAKGLPQANVKIDGQGAPPRVVLTSPSGETLSSPNPPGASAQNALGALGPSDYAEASFAALPKPQAGTWRVDLLPGSSQIESVAVAEGLPDVKITAKVKKRGGRKRLLAYKAKKIDGQKVRFYEIGEGVSKRIGTIKGGKGKLGFSAADGPRGKRRIVAAIDSFGLPRDRINVATYRAPGPVKLKMPRGLRVRRKGSKLVAKWLRTRGAKRYVAAIRLKDGRRLSLTTRKTSVTVRHVPGIDSAKLRVAGLKADNSPGRAAKAKLKAKPKKRRKKGRR